jgi:hypothetical protein
MSEAKIMDNIPQYLIKLRMDLFFSNTMVGTFHQKMEMEMDRIIMPAKP